MVLRQAASLNDKKLFEQILEGVKRQKLSVKEILSCLAACVELGYKDEDVLMWGVGKLA